MTTRNKMVTRARRPDSAKGTGAVRKESSARQDTPDFAQVQLRIHEIECFKTTKEIDRDEMKLAAIKVEGKLETSGGKRKLAAKAERGDILDAGQFKKGETRKYQQPRTVLSFAAGDGDAGVWSLRSGVLSG